MNLKIFTTALLATGAIAGRQGSEAEIFNAQAAADLHNNGAYNKMPHEKQRRGWVRLFLNSRSMIQGCLGSFKVIVENSFLSLTEFQLKIISI